MSSKIRVHIVGLGIYRTSIVRAFEKKGYQVDFSDVLKRVSYGKQDFTVLIRKGLSHSEEDRAGYYVDKSRLITAENADDAERKINGRLSKR